MPINFHDPKNKQTYTTRKADVNWKEAIGSLLELHNYHHALDIGCGGGIYSKALYDIGIPTITGMDFSKEMIEEAKANCENYSQINFTVGNAYDTGLTSQSYDLVFKRALIHHLHDLSACLSEAFRLLKGEGTILIQDRTPTDCLLEGSSNHIRGYFFDLFPRLKEMEKNRRYSSLGVIKALNTAGFTNIQEIKLWEVRQIYASKNDLLTDLRMKTGRSILHELSDPELIQLVDFIDSKLPETEGIIEKDRWTIWKAIKR